MCVCVNSLRGGEEQESRQVDSQPANQPVGSDDGGGGGYGGLVSALVTSTEHLMNHQLRRPGEGFCASVSSLFVTTVTRVRPTTRTVWIESCLPSGRPAIAEAAIVRNECSEVS